MTVIGGIAPFSLLVRGAGDGEIPLLATTAMHVRRAIDELFA